MRAALLLVALVLAAPAAAAWAVDAQVPMDGALSTRSSLLVAGALRASAPGAALGALDVSSMDFGDGLVVVSCPESSVQPGLGDCPGAETNEAARIRLRAGAIILIPIGGGNATLEAAAGVGALGGANLTSRVAPLGPALFAGGDLTLRAEGDAFQMRGLTPDTSIVVRGTNGSHDYNGTGFVLRLTGAQGATLRAEGGFLRLADGTRVDVAPAPLADAERAISTEALYAVIRALVPPERADRRADLVDAFGPIQTVPALLNGVVAASANLTLAESDHEGFVLVRVSDAHIVTDNGTWRLRGNASATVQGRDFSTDADDPPNPPIVIPSVLALGAIAAWIYTPRATPARRTRRLAALARILEAALLLAIAAWTAEGLLGVNPLADWSDLSGRARAQLLLLAGGMVALATLLVGLSVTSLAKSLYAWRGKPAARVVPSLTGAAATALLLLTMTPELVTLVARVVRL